jgi:shikimate kinase
MHVMTSIVLTGFMGTGKTTVGHLLAERLGYSFVDTDLVIEERFGPIPEIFRTRGEDGFRTVERSTVAELASLTDAVISTGGRAMLDPQNVRAFAGVGRTVCLQAGTEEIVERLTADPLAAERPLLAGEDPATTIRTLLADRAPEYGRFPQLDTSGVAPGDLAEVLAREFRPAPATGRPQFVFGAGSLALVGTDLPTELRTTLCTLPEHLEWMAALTAADASAAVSGPVEETGPSDHLVVVGAAHHTDPVESAGLAAGSEVTVVPTTLDAALKRTDTSSAHRTLVDFGLLQYPGALDVGDATAKRLAVATGSGADEAADLLANPTSPAFFGLMRTLFSTELGAEVQS